MRLVCGVGINDVPNMAKTRIYQTWADMIKRCYSKKLKERRPTYQDVTCSPDWLYLSKFISDISVMTGSDIDGWQLDKDVLFCGNKVYSKETCCFVPSEINNLFVKSSIVNRDLPIGVVADRNNNGFRANVNFGGWQFKSKSFSSADGAFNEYKKLKEDYIKTVAEKYKNSICEKVYSALMNYEVKNHV